jgi:hypothetical protein
MLYPSAPVDHVNVSKPFYFSANLLSDPRFDRNKATVTKNADGSFHVVPGITRLLMFTEDRPLNKSQLGTLITNETFAILKTRGYWYKPTDFKNVEITIYYRQLDSNVSAGRGDEFSLVSRSILHQKGFPIACGGSSYHNNLLIDGHTRFKKEQWHVHYWIGPTSDKTAGNITGKWIGFKGIVYNIPGTTKVKLENWIDKDANNTWEKYQEMIDNDDHGDAMTDCGSSVKGASILWGSPNIIIKTNHMEFDFKDFSVREIIPPPIATQKTTEPTAAIGPTMNNISKVNTSNIEPQARDYSDTSIVRRRV